MQVDLTNDEVNEIIIAMKARATDELDIDDLYKDADYNLPTISGSGTMAEVETTPWMSILKKLNYDRYNELNAKAKEFLDSGELISKSPSSI